MLLSGTFPCHLPQMHSPCSVGRFDFEKKKNLTNFYEFYATLTPSCKLAVTSEVILRILKTLASNLSPETAYCKVIFLRASAKQQEVFICQIRSRIFPPLN